MDSRIILVFSGLIEFFFQKSTIDSHRSLIYGYIDSWKILGFPGLIDFFFKDQPYTTQAQISIKILFLYSKSFFNNTVHLEEFKDTGS